VRNRKAFFEAAVEARIRLSDWFLSPIHPVQRGFLSWNLSVDTVPTAQAIAGKLLTINTETRDADRVCTFINQFLGLIE
jgi:hypothetical protein